MAFVIGLDIGGTKIEGVLVKAAGAVTSSSLPTILKKVRVPTNAAAGRAAVIRNMVAVVVALFEYGRKNVRGFKLAGIGVGTAGFLKNGKLEMVPNIPAIKGVRLKEVLSRQLRLRKIKAPLHVENDSVCFALAEFMFGAARGCENVIGVIVGTGIGGGLILGGRIYSGRDAGAGQIGHTTIDPSGQKCGCGQRGHFESWCSGKYITQRYVAAGGKIASPDPKKIFNSKDAVAKRIMNETYDKFGMAFANLINTFNPDIIVMGGGVSNLPAGFYRGIAAAVRKYACPAMADGVKIARNRLGDDAGVYGAAALAAIKK